MSERGLLLACTRATDVNSKAPIAQSLKLNAQYLTYI